MSYFYFRTKVEFSSGGESFHCTGQYVITEGFTSITPWLAVSEKKLPDFAKGEKIKISKVELYEVIFKHLKLYDMHHSVLGQVENLTLKPSQWKESHN